MDAKDNPPAASPSLPTREAIERRRASLSLRLDLSRRQPRPQPSPPPSYPPEPPPEPLESETQPEANLRPTPDAEALHGLAGQVVRTIAPHTEADPSAILLQFLVAFGNLLGPKPHCVVESTRHNLNLFLVLVGESSKARKGTSWSHLRCLFTEIDQPWATRQITNARLTADGLIHAVRDELADRRLLLLAEEFGSVLQALTRQNGHLSPLLRCAWDSGDLRTLDRHHPLQATGTHISLIGHITHRELAPLLSRSEAHNGFANRCLWACVRRSQCLPEGGNLTPQDLSALARELRRVLDWVATAPENPFQRTPAAQELWRELYPTLSDTRPGLHGAATSRAEAQVLRLSAIYAALDTSPVIDQPHLQAALAVWDNCSAAAGQIFNPAVEDEIAGVIRHALHANPNGLSRDQIRKLFYGHVTADRIDAALHHLAAKGAVTHHTQAGRGRAAIMWEAAATNQSGPE